MLLKHQLKSNSALILVQLELLQGPIFLQRIYDGIHSNRQFVKHYTLAERVTTIVDTNLQSYLTTAWVWHRRFTSLPQQHQLYYSLESEAASNSCNEMELSSRYMNCNTSITPLVIITFSWLSLSIKQAIFFVYNPLIYKTTILASKSFVCLLYQAIRENNLGS